MSQSELFIIIGSASFAALVAVGVTVAIERWGGVVGGLLGTLPTTIVPASIGFTQQAADQQALVNALCATPPGMLLNVGFLWLWRVLPRRIAIRATFPRVTLLLTLTLSAWGGFATVFVLGMDRLGSVGISMPILGGAAALLMLIAGILACSRRPPAPSAKRAVRGAVLISRGLLAGAAIGVAVWMVNVAGPIAAGVASVFPAIFLTTMVSLSLAHGDRVQVGAVGPMMLGSSSVSAYALLAAWLIPAIGLTTGAVAAWMLGVLTTTLPAWLWLNRQDR